MFLVHIDRFPGLGIAAVPGIALFHRKGPEAAQFDPVAARHGLDDLLENCVYDPLDVTPKQMRVFVSKKLKQFGTGHHSPRRRNGFMTSFAGLVTKIYLGKGSRFYSDASFGIAAQERGKSIEECRAAWIARRL